MTHSSAHSVYSLITRLAKVEVNSLGGGAPPPQEKFCESCIKPRHYDVTGGVQHPLITLLGSTVCMKKYYLCYTMYMS